MNVLTRDQHNLLRDILDTKTVIDTDTREVVLGIMLFGQYDDSDKLWLNELRNRYILFKNLKKRANKIWPKL